MNTQDNIFNASELCSRKLWQLVLDASTDHFDDSELHEAIAELTHRRHYLEQLELCGVLDEKPVNG